MEQFGEHSALDQPDQVPAAEGAASEYSVC